MPWIADRVDRSHAPSTRSSRASSACSGRAPSSAALVALVRGERDLRQLAGVLRARARTEGIAEGAIGDTIALGRRAHRMALSIAHYEDLRALLSSWRWLHRWVAALMVLLVIVHVVHALFYGGSVRGPTG